MRGLNEARARAKIIKDLAEVRKSATFVLMVPREDEQSVFIYQNQQPSLSVLAIIGQPNAFSKNADEMIISAAKGLEEVVLAEIGIKRTYPYREARRLRRGDGESYEIADRKTWFALTSKQYQEIAPSIFEAIEKIAYMNGLHCKWGRFSKNHNPYRYRYLRRRWSGRQNRIVGKMSSKREAENYSTFSVSLKDEFLLQDIFWAEKHLNFGLKKKIKGFRILLNSVVTGSGGDIRAVKRVLRISRLPKHLLREIIPTGSYFKGIAQIMKWENPEADSREDELIKSVLPNPASRLSRIKLQITTDLDAGKDHIVFRVFPQRIFEEIK